jgi:DNA-directed RNA polymerase specialized sigma24 family protein
MQPWAGCFQCARGWKGVIMDRRVRSSEARIRSAEAKLQRNQETGRRQEQVAAIGQAFSPAERHADGGLAEAVARVRNGDDEAYEVIYAACDRELRAFVGKRHGHLGDAFVDEVDIRTHEYVFSNLNRYNPDRGVSFQTWVNWQSNNVAIQVKAEWFDLHKVRTPDGRWERVAGSVPMDEAAREVMLGSPPEPPDAPWRRHRLWKEYEALSNEGRLSVALHDICGLTLPETASALGMPLIRLRRLLDQCHSRLRKRLKRAGIRPGESMPHYGMVARYGNDGTGYEEEWTATETARLPFVPDSLDSTALEPEEEGLEERTESDA